MFPGEHHIPIPLGPADQPLWKNKWGYGSFYGPGTDLKSRREIAGDAITPRDPYGIDQSAMFHDLAYEDATTQLETTGDVTEYYHSTMKADRELISDMFSSDAPAVYKLGTSAVFNAKIAYYTALAAISGGDQITDAQSSEKSRIPEPTKVDETGKKWRRSARTLRVPPDSQDQFPYAPLGFTLNNSAYPYPGESSFDPEVSSRKYKKRKKARQNKPDRRTFLDLS